MWLRPDDQLDIHDCYLQAVGRSVLLAQNFEQNCKFVALVWDLGAAHQRGELSSADLPDYASVLLKRFLGEIVSRFGKEYGIEPEQYDILKNAKDARNFIAHEAATYCIVPTQTPEPLLEELPTFRANVEALAAGDNLISGWSYMIQEKDYPPSGIRQRYPSEIVAWIFEPLSHYE